MSEATPKAQQLAEAFRNAFTGESGRIALEHLHEICGQRGACGVGASALELAYWDGRRGVWLEIASLMSIKPEREIDLTLEALEEESHLT